MAAKRIPVEMDGSRGEGGGQVLRTSLSLAAVLGVELRIDQVRAGRRKPGLLRQHLACVRAIAEITDARVEGAELSSTAVCVRPRTIEAGDYRFAVGSAGSALLVLQTVLPPLLFADGESTVTIGGGTHNPLAPPFEAVAESFLPALRAMGAEVDVELVRPGYMPAGGGEIRARVRPWTSKAPLDLAVRGKRRAQRVDVVLSHLDRRIGEREMREVARALDVVGREVHIVQRPESRSPGNVVVAVLGYEYVTEVFVAIGRQGVPGKRVVRELGRDVSTYLASDAPVGEHLADQLLLPMALGAGGRFVTSRPSLHTRTNAEVIESFLPARVRMEDYDGATVVSLDGRA